jgi:hypothetical protein
MVLDCSYFLQGCNGGFFASIIDLDNVLFTLGLHKQSKLPRSPLVEVSRLHVIFDFNGVLVAKRTMGFHTQMKTNSTLTLKFGIERFFNKLFISI